ncbi:hypothetical protein SAMN02982929_04221 [Saccharopolyspora kobensis]|uniref:Uncharacterized protein n=2 Tax=Saccharopolyspora kobensis TaxID=146035 RepID=A0A1H6DDS8_9PSEU|nr:hypothetical protein SAMN02982929_04221 [Saccharopolyspora kobensis]SFE29451.1 hypothetical protein SAMN05216506_110138 [Saccharopolyspora kobensis]
MSAEAVALAVLLRRAQWLLDDLAYRIVGGRFDAGELTDTADALDELAVLLKEKALSEGTECSAPSRISLPSPRQP